MAKRTDVDINVRAHDKATPQIGKVDKSLQQMSKRTEQSFKKTLLPAWVKFTAATTAAGVALKKAFDASKYAADVLQVRMSFESIARESGLMADEVIDSLGRMAGDTINELDLMLAASRASLLGLPMDKLDELMQIARASATATGQSVQQMFSDIVVGIGRASPMILDNLGITVKIGKANEVYAESIGKTVRQLSDQEKKQALLNAVLTSGEDIIRKVGEAGQIMTPSEYFQQTTAAVQNMTETIGSVLLPAFLATTKVATQMAKGVTKTINQLRKDVAAPLPEIEVPEEPLSRLEDKVKSLSEIFLPRAVEKLTELESKYETVQAALKLLEDEMGWHVKALNENEQAQFTNYLSLLDLEASFKSTGEASAGSAQALRELNLEYKDAIPDRKEYIETTEEEIDRLNKLIKPRKDAEEAKEDVEAAAKRLKISQAYWKWEIASLEKVTDLNEDLVTYGRTLEYVKKAIGKEDEEWIEHVTFIKEQLEEQLGVTSDIKDITELIAVAKGNELVLARTIEAIDLGMITVKEGVREETEKNLKYVTMTREELERQLQALKDQARAVARIEWKPPELVMPEPEGFDFATWTAGWMDVGVGISSAVEGIDDADKKAKAWQKTLDKINEVWSDIQTGIDIINTTVGGFFDAWNANIDATTQNQITALEAQLEAVEAGSDEEKKILDKITQIKNDAAMSDFRRSQATSVANAIMSAAGAIIKCYELLGPIGGTIAAIGVGVITAAQIALIAGTAPPAFAKGGRVDEPTYALVGEKGPEWIIPEEMLKRGFGTTIVNNFYVQGSYIAREGLGEEVMGYIGGEMRGY